MSETPDETAPTAGPTTFTGSRVKPASRPKFSAIFQVASFQESGIPKTVERVMMAIILPAGPNVDAGKIEFAIFGSDDFGKFKHGDVYTVTFEKLEGLPEGQ